MAFLFYVVFEVHESVSRIFLVLPITNPGNIEFPFIFLAIYFYLCLESPCFQGILTSKLIHNAQLQQLTNSQLVIL